VSIQHPSEAPRVDIPTVPGPTDCIPSLIAAGRTAPVVTVDYYGGTAWSVCDMELARQALTDRRLSKDVELTPEWMRIPGVMLGSQPKADYARTMVMSEGADHARIRRLHSHIFTPRNIARWHSHVADLADKHLDELAELSTTARDINLVDNYTYRLPLGFFCDILGLRADMHPLLRRAIDDIIYSPEQSTRARAVGHLAGLVATWASDPEQLQDGLLTGLLAAVDSDDAVTPNEVVTWTVGLVMAGYESTASLISSAIFEALRRPAEHWPRTDAQVEAWIEETLRLHPPFPHATWRFATENIDLGGFLIPEGAPVQVNIAAANRCPYSDESSRFDPGAGRDHISFGLGHHYCMGAPMVRLEACLALSAFLRRYGDAHLSPEAPVQWESEWMTRRINVLPVRLSAGPAEDWTPATEGA
jgi:cytochrome P450